MPEGKEVDTLDIRPFSSLEEYEGCAEFQEEIWGIGFKERVSAAILMIANRLGGLAAGAYDEEGRLQGFVFGLTGVQGGRTVHWSDMLAVRSRFRDRGLGTRLKYYQREVLLGRGVTRMHWTFDPLQSRNAYVNFRKLGIISREYVRDMYGSTGSPLHEAVGTDRLIATWEMDSHRVVQRLEGRDDSPVPGGWSGLPRALEGRGGDREPEPATPRLGLTDESVLVAIPRDVDRIMAHDPALALRWREATRGAFQDYLARGYEVRELLPEAALSHYLLRRSDLRREGSDSTWEGGDEGT